MFNQILGDESKRVGKWAAVSLILLSAFLLIRVFTDLKRLPRVGNEVYPQSTIMVTGEGEAFAVPDVASFNFTITEASETVDSAQKMLDEKTAKAVAVLKEAGIEEKDIKTISYNVYPKYEWQQIYCITYPCPQGDNKLVGYEVSQNILVKVRKVDTAGDLVNKVGAIGVANISGVEFTVDDRQALVAKAREEAINKAKEQAKLLAKQLGVRLGKIMYYNDNSGYPVPYYGDMAVREGMGGGMVLPTKAVLPAGETKITSNISITYEIK